MTQIKVISLDLEGTLVTPKFSDTVWNTEIPRLFSEAHGLTLEDSTKYVLSAYREIGEHRLEWYDIKYWFDRFGLNGHLGLLNGSKREISYYEDAEPALAQLCSRFKLVIASNSSRDFLDLLLGKMRSYFSTTFSSISDFGIIKTPEFYLRICEALTAAPEEVIHIGDNWTFDYLAASDAGITAFHLDRQARLPEEPTVSDLRQFASRIEALAGDQ